MITAEEARENLIPKDEVLETYLTHVVEAKIRKASDKYTTTGFGIFKVNQGGWMFQTLPDIGSWDGRPFNKVKFTSVVIDILKESGYKVEIEETANLSGVKFGMLMVSWGEE